MRGGSQEDTLNVQVSVCDNQLALLHVNHQSKVSQEIGTKDGMGCCTSVMMKIHGSDCLSLRLRVSECFPYVQMEVSFTVMRVSLSREGQRLVGREGGIALTSILCQ